MRLMRIQDKIFIFKIDISKVFERERIHETFVCYNFSQFERHFIWFFLTKAIVLIVKLAKLRQQEVSQIPIVT